MIIINKSFNFFNEYILVLESHNQAIFVYNNIRRKGFSVQLIATPCMISSGCTQCVKFREEYINVIKKEIKESNIKIKGIYKIVKNGYKNSYKLVNF